MSSCHPFVYVDFKKEITKGFAFLEYDKRSNVFHPGYDYNKNQGKGPNGDLNEPVHACKRAIVLFEGWVKGYGYLIVLEHEDGTVSRYAHNNKILVEKGQMVEEGQVIGLAGRSGTISVHCHHELWTNQLVEYLKKIRPKTWFLFYPNGRSRAWVAENYLNPLTTHTYSA